jgi:AcrR family transcriptional regulator
MIDTMKERLTRATVAAIEARKGIQGISLRGVAKDAGCSHVNAYHYADGLQGLFWLAYVVALDAFSEACLGRVAERLPGDNFGEALAEAVVEFAQAREGLYRLLWFEALEGGPTGAALEAVRRSKGLFLELGSAALREAGVGDGPDGVGSRLEILFAYLQGEVGLLINGRSGTDPAKAKQEISGRARRVWNLLAGEAR